MPNGDGPWTKYQSATPKQTPTPQQSQGPWTKYAAPTSPSPIDPLVTGKGMEEAAHRQATPAPRILPSVPPEPSVLGGGNVQEAEIMRQTQKQYPNATSPQTIGATGGSIIAGAATGGMSLLPRMAAQFIGGGAGEAAGQAASGKVPSVGEAAATGAGFAAGEGIISGASKLLSKTEPLARLNKILGVTPKEIRVGTTPETLSAFNSNPSRGVSKVMQESGISEKQLAKMNPLERLKFVTEARNKAGQELDDVLKAASAPATPGTSLATTGGPTGQPLLPGSTGPTPQRSAKIINVQKIMDETFKNAIPDKGLAKLTAKRFQQILDMTGIKTPLSQLSPIEARVLQRQLDEFANFAPEGTLKTFRDVATSLRRGISKETGRVVPESVALDQHYGDLAGATKALRKQAAKYATTAPKTFLQKHGVKMAYGAGGALLAGAGFEGAKHLVP